MLRDVYNSVKIFGWTAPLFLPICLSAFFDGSLEPTVWEAPPETEHEWLRTEFCQPCGIETDHQWLQFKDEPVVTRECLNCEHVSTYWDAV